MSDELIDDNNIGKFRSQAIRSNFIIEFFSQLKVMLKRNFILQLRYRNSTLAQTILAPLIFQLLLFVLQQADYERQRESNPHPTPYSLTGIPTCQGTSYQDNNCINIFYTPAEEPYTSFMKTFAELNSKRMNQPPFPIEDPIDDTNFTPTKNLGIVGVPNADFIYDYVFQNPNTTRWGITFNQTKNETGPTPNLNIQYQIWYNVSLTANSSDIFGNELLGFVRGLDEAIITNLNDPNAKVTADIDVSLKDWPIIPPSTVSDLVVQQLGPVFFFCSEMVIFISVINQIVSEKELKLRIALEMMGLKPSVFWLSNFISNSVLVLCNALVTVLLGIAFNFTAFKNTSFFVNLLLFFLFGEAMVCFAYFITCFVQKAKIGILIGIFMFIIGLLFESFVFSSPFVGYIWWDPKSVDPIAWKTLIFIPFFNFGKMFLDIGSFTSGYRDALSDTFIPGPGFSVETLYDTLPSNLLPNYGDNNQPQVPRPVDSIFYLLMNIAFYYTLTLYFDQIVPNEFGNYRNLLFFLTPSYWGFSNKKELKNVEWLKKVKANSGGIVLDNEEEDVVEERKVALSNEHWPAIKIVNLRKVFRKSRFYKSKIDKIAVKDSCLTFEEGKLLALLGQNGAGKSTTMNILSGLTPATKGDALIYGYSVRYQMSKINEIMGSCPQHDILFEDLTAKEHIELYAGLKGVPKKDWPMLIEDRLKCVRLWQVRNARAGTYSGG
ncbi:ATP-binding cassette sub- A member 1 [Clydaea vesicula]|uniref:ATP-binding cassette sub- A member 1 n=1 Tax=Clydaea vesicula TaxID=447962 RepID=A0AAD5XZQ2_9FUNG|nr:ATP-binding cassette sub- A member 1 [Clydaea vesicula]